MRIAVVPSWYPTDDDPVRGHFFARHVEALGETNEVHLVSPARGTSLPAFCRFVAARLPQIDPDIVHAHVATPAGLAALLSRPRVRAPVVLTEHSGPLDRLYSGSAARRQVVRRILASVDALATPSRGTAEEIAALGVRREIFEIPNPAPELPLPAHEPVAGRAVAVGLMDDDSKGLPDLLVAWSLARSAVPGAELVIVGDGAARPALESRATSLGIASTVRFVGTRTPDETRAIVGRASVFVSSSVHESFGLAGVEAAALGRSLVLTDVGVASRLVAGGLGRLVAPRDAENLGTALGQALAAGPPASRAAIRANALARFGPSAVARATGEVYRAAFSRVSETRRRRPLRRRSAPGPQGERP